MQIYGSLSGCYPGAGVGLFIAGAIVSAHGGQLSLTSEPGAGTTARIALPKARVVTAGAA
jgi:signal transduction histidine kinase